jgi:hypothetical protein
MTQLELMTNRDLSAAARVVGWLLYTGPNGLTNKEIVARAGLALPGVYGYVIELESKNLITGIKIKGRRGRVLKWVGPEAVSE